MDMRVRYYIEYQDNKIQVNMRQLPSKHKQHQPCISTQTLTSLAPSQSVVIRPRTQSILEGKETCRWRSNGKYPSPKQHTRCSPSVQNMSDVPGLPQVDVRDPQSDLSPKLTTNRRLTYRSVRVLQRAVAGFSNFLLKSALVCTIFFWAAPVGIT